MHVSEKGRRRRKASCHRRSTLRALMDGKCCEIRRTKKILKSLQFSHPFSGVLDQQLTIDASQFLHVHGRNKVFDPEQEKQV